MAKKIFKGTIAFLVLITVLFVLFIGPWPVYKDTNYSDASYYKNALSAIDRSASASNFTTNPDQLEVGWGVRDMTPPIGTPLGGYGDRKGAPSTGVHDSLYVKAIAFHDGVDTVVFVGADMLLVPPNIADLVREKVASETPLSADNLYFTASHNHCGPGAFGPGLAARISSGKHDPKVVAFLAEQYADAIIEAYKNLEPGKMAHGAFDLPEFIRNRTRDAQIDSFLHYMVAEQNDGDQCYVMRYSAHPTNYGGSMMEFTAEYPGALQRTLEKETGATAVFLGGAVGSMGPRRPEVPEGSNGADAMGEAIAKAVLANVKDLEFEDHIDVASVGFPVTMPSMQIRPFTPNWRLSPLAKYIMGVPSEGWMQGARLGEVCFVGMPFDFSGEVSRDWQYWAKNEGIELWPTGFSAAYFGYLSPDRYYFEVDDKGHLDYEVGFMNWYGPNTEAYCTDLCHHIVEAMQAPTQQAKQGS